MFMKKMMKLGLIASTAIVFMACGGGSGGNAAIDKLISYATTGEPVPTAADYAAAGVNGVTDDNVALANSIILGLLKEEVDTKEEVQALADAAGVSLVPRAVIVVSRNFAPKGGSIDFNGLSSTDLDGAIVSYVWTLNGGVLSSEATFSKADLPYGTHTITLTVTDDEGNVGQTTVQVRIEDVNNAPVADAGPDQTIKVSGGNMFVFAARFVAYADMYMPMQAPISTTTVKLDGRMSNDDGGSLTYLWEVIQGNVVLSYADTSTPAFEVSCDNLGVIIIRLTVSDGTHTSTDTVKITVVAEDGACNVLL